MISIICADDDPDIQALYKVILGKRDFDLRICVCGMQAVESFKDRPSDLVLLDMEMPGLSGLETCKEIRSLPTGATIPILIVSSKDTEEIIMEALSTGANDYILKPFRSAELLAKINFAIKKRQAGFKTDVALSYTDKYEIIKKIDEGGQTIVYLGKDSSVEPSREVALKIFNPAEDEKSQSEFKTLFLREAYEWSKLKHENIVELYDFGQSSGSYYMVLEFINGKTLWDHVEDDGPLDEQSLLMVAHELTLSLEYMESFNLVHRDIKPNNILLSFQGEVKLTDFGLAKQKEDDKVTITENVFKGTPDFVSPEQIEGQKYLSIESDVYSLGATLYFAATGELPFKGNTVIETLNNHFNIVPSPVHKVNSKYTKDFSDLIKKMLAKKKNDRITISKLKDSVTSMLNQYQ